MNNDEIGPSAFVMKVTTAISFRDDEHSGQMTRILMSSEIQSKRKNLVPPQLSRHLLSGYFTLLEKLISSSRLPQDLKQMKMPNY